MYGSGGTVAKIASMLDYPTKSHVTVKKFKNPDMPFKWKHFQGDIILWLVRWYGRYALSYNDLKEIAEERGLMINRSTIVNHHPI